MGSGRGDWLSTSGFETTCGGVRSSHSPRYTIPGAASGRAPDAVFFYLTKTEAGDFRAMQPREVFRSQQYGTAVYRSELSARLRSIGYEIQVEKNGTPEIKGYSREYLEANSLRSQQIREHLKSAGLGGAAAAQIAAHRTREAKLNLTRDEVTVQHRDLASKV